MVNVIRLIGLKDREGHLSLKLLSGKGWVGKVKDSSPSNDMT
jgi:hypothetical protein